MVAARPDKDQRRPATSKRVTLEGAHIAVLLTIRHDDAQFAGVLLDRVLPPVQRAPVEDGHTRHVTCRVRHDRESASPIDRLEQLVGPRARERLGRYGH